MVVADLPRVLEDHHDAVPLQEPSDPFECYSYLHLQDDDDEEEGQEGDNDSSSPLSEPDPVWTPEHGLAASEVSEDYMSSSPLWPSDPLWNPELDLARCCQVSEDNSESSSPPPGPSDSTICPPRLDLSASFDTPKDSDSSSSAPQGPSGLVWGHYDVLHVAASEGNESSEGSQDSQDSEESLEPSPQGPWEPLWFPLPDLLEEESDWADVCHLGDSPEFQLGYSREQEEDVEADQYDVDDDTPWGEWDREKSWGNDSAWAGKGVGACGWAERMSRLSQWMSC